MKTHGTYSDILYGATETIITAGPGVITMGGTGAGDAYGGDKAGTYSGTWARIVSPPIKNIIVKFGPVDSKYVGAGVKGAVFSDGIVCG